MHVAMVVAAVALAIGALAAAVFVHGGRPQPALAPAAPVGDDLATAAPPEAGSGMPPSA